MTILKTLTDFVYNFKDIEETKARFEGFIGGYTTCLTNDNARPTKPYFRTSEVTRKERFRTFMQPLYDFKEELRRYDDILVNEIEVFDSLVERIEKVCLEDLNLPDLDKPEFEIWGSEETKAIKSEEAK